MMADVFYRKVYGQKWFIWHVLLSVIILLLYFLLLYVLKIDYRLTLDVVSTETISLSASMAGFVFAGMSIFISLDGSKKMATISSIGQDGIIYSILVASVSFFVISLLLMGGDLIIFNLSQDQMTNIQLLTKNIVQWGSIYSLLLGFLFFLSSIKLIHWILKK